MSYSEIKNSSSATDYFSYIKDCYKHLPSVRTAAVGVSVGLARIAAKELCLKSMPWLSTPLTTTTKFHPLMLSAIIAPFIEEPLFRKDLEAKVSAVVFNAIGFGLLHGLLPGSLELKMARVFMSTTGGLFYGVAQTLTDDVWAPTIAHLMYNSSSFIQFFQA